MPELHPVVVQDRAALRDALRELVEGRMRTEDFNWNVYYRLGGSADAGVRGINRWAWALYSDDVDYHLTGRYALPPEVLECARRCYLFLESEQQYEWPELESVRSLGAQFCFTGMALSLLAAGCTSLLALYRGGYALLPFLLAVLALALYRLGNHFRRQVQVDVERYEGHGDIEVWPFLTRAAYQRARAMYSDQ